MPDDPSENQDVPRITQSDHVQLRSIEGRPIGLIYQDIQRASPNDIFIQSDDGRYVIRGGNGREHILESNGEHLTTVQFRSNLAHRKRVEAGKIRKATEEEVLILKKLAEH